MSWLTKVEAWGWRTVDSLIQRIGVMPMTNTRQAVTFSLMIGTGVVYLALAVKYAVIEGARQWEPSLEWLGFLLISAGLDAAQFLGKRKTDAAYVAAMQGGTPDTKTTTTTAGPSTTVTEPTP